MHAAPMLAVLTSYPQLLLPLGFVGFNSQTKEHMQAPIHILASLASVSSSTAAACSLNCRRRRPVPAAARC
jgi:hypothetical protein